MKFPSRLELFLINYDVINRKPNFVVTRSTIQKWAKRTPDATVETTIRPRYCHFNCILSNRQVSLIVKVALATSVDKVFTEWWKVRELQSENLMPGESKSKDCLLQTKTRFEWLEVVVYFDRQNFVVVFDTRLGTSPKFKSWMVF